MSFASFMPNPQEARGAYDPLIMENPQVKYRKGNDGEQMRISKRNLYEMKRRARRGKKGVGPILDVLSTCNDVLKEIARTMMAIKDDGGSDNELAAIQSHFWEIYDNQPNNH